MAPPYEQLITVLAGDGELDQSWALAVEHGCTDLLWSRLAEAREAEHPLDAAGVYRRQVDDLLANARTVPMTRPSA